MSDYKTATRMWALDAPSLDLPDKGILMVGAPHEPITVPCPAYLIEHPKGLVLWDTSFHPLAGEDPAAIYGAGLDSFGMRFNYTPEQRIDRQIRQLGYKVSDVKYVIASHAHFDHAGGLFLFPDSRIIFGAKEIPYALWPHPLHAGIFRRDDIFDVPRGNFWEIEQDLDLFGDGSLVILLTPGHTPGELSLLVRLPQRNMILTGDTVHLRDALENALPIPIDVNADEAMRSIRRLQIVAAQNDADLWVHHDPGDWAMFGGARVYE